MFYMFAVFGSMTPKERNRVARGVAARMLERSQYIVTPGPVSAVRDHAARRIEHAVCRAPETEQLDPDDDSGTFSRWNGLVRRDHVARVSGARHAKCLQNTIRSPPP